MDEREILEKLTTVFRQVFDDESIVAKPEMTAADVERWDSLSHVDMIICAEEAFGIRIPVREVVGLKNVGGMVQSDPVKTSMNNGTDSFHIRITEELIDAFATLTGDRSSIHVNPEFARLSRFRRPRHAWHAPARLPWGMGN